MMTAELLELLIRANISASLAILVIVALRVPARRLLGAQFAYGLWALAPLAFGASLAPRRAASASDPAISQGEGLMAMIPDAAPAIWLAGALTFVALLAFSQWRFLQAARAGRAGPAMVGVIAPRFVTPADYAVRYAPEERDLIRAHERAHVERLDPRVNAMIALIQCVSWFNPLVHLAAVLARVDQELACDATVVARHPQARRTYAQAMLKTALGTTPLPLGCRWLAHPLEVRIGMLKAPPATPHRRAAGLCGLGVLALMAIYGAWLAQPLEPPRAVWRPERPIVLHLSPGVETVVLPTRR